MLSRSGDSFRGLVCSDCGTPVTSLRDAAKPHPVVSSLVMLGMASFSMLLFFLTNWRPTQAQAPGRGHSLVQDRSMIRQLTTGNVVAEPELLDKEAHHE